MAEYLLGLDSGTTGVRAKIYDTTGAVIASASQEYECEYPRPGWVEQDVHVLSEANLDVLRRVVTDSGVDTARLRSLGLSTQRGLHLYVDETGKVLRNGRGLSWQDARHGCQLDQLREQVGEERFHEITGLPIAAFWPVGKILWVAQNEPGVLARTARIISTQELFLRQLSDVEEYHVDRSNASLFGLMDVDRLEWSPELLDFLGLSENLLPTIVPSAHQVGHVTSDVRTPHGPTGRTSRVHRRGRPTMCGHRRRCDLTRTVRADHRYGRKLGRLPGRDPAGHRANAQPNGPRNA